MLVRLIFVTIAKETTIDLYHFMTFVLLRKIKNNHLSVYNPESNSILRGVCGTGGFSQEDADVSWLRSNAKVRLRCILWANSYVWVLGIDLHAAYTSLWMDYAMLW